MDGYGLFERTVTTVQEMYLKMGSFEGSISLYHPFEGDFRSVEREFEEKAEGILKGTTVEQLPGRIRVILPQEDCESICRLPFKESMVRIDELIRSAGGIEAFEEGIGSSFPDANVIRSEYIEFDWILYFTEGTDDDIYCIAEEMGVLTYHRFTREEFAAFGFELPE